MAHLFSFLFLTDENLIMERHQLSSSLFGGFFAVAAFASEPLQLLQFKSSIYFDKLV